jgi:hypothetical protein
VFALLPLAPPIIFPIPVVEAAAHLTLHCTSGSTGRASAESYLLPDSPRDVALLTMFYAPGV